MARPQNKADLLKAAEDNFNTLKEFCDSMSDAEKNTEFDFSSDASKKEAHWGRDKNLRDILVHLYEWLVLMEKFVANNQGCIQKSGAISFIPAPYSFKTYGQMNIEIWKNHQKTSLESAWELLETKHKKVISLIEGFSNEELFTKAFFCWTGTSSLGSYFVSSTSSHYDWALKKLKAHRKNLSK